MFCARWIDPPWFGGYYLRIIHPPQLQIVDFFWLNTAKYNIPRYPCRAHPPVIWIKHFINLI